MKYALFVYIRKSELKKFQDYGNLAKIISKNAVNHKTWEELLQQDEHEHRMVFVGHESTRKYIKINGYEVKYSFLQRVTVCDTLNKAKETALKLMIKIDRESLSYYMNNTQYMIIVSFLEENAQTDINEVMVYNPNCLVFPSEEKPPSLQSRLIYHKLLTDKPVLINSFIKENKLTPVTEYVNDDYPNRIRNINRLYFGFVYLALCSTVELPPEIFWRIASFILIEPGIRSEEQFNHLWRGIFHKDNKSISEKFFTEVRKKDNQDGAKRKKKKKLLIIKHGPRKFRIFFEESNFEKLKKNIKKNIGGLFKLLRGR